MDHRLKTALRRWHASGDPQAAQDALIAAIRAGLIPDVSGKRNEFNNGPFTLIEWTGSWRTLSEEAKEWVSSHGEASEIFRKNYLINVWQEYDATFEEDAVPKEIRDELNRAADEDIDFLAY